MRLIEFVTGTYYDGFVLLYFGVLCSLVTHIINSLIELLSLAAKKLIDKYFKRSKAYKDQYQWMRYKIP